MKHFFFSFTIVGLLFFTGCASSGSSTSDNTRRSGNEVVVDNPNLGLDVYLRRLSGVRVQGSGQNAQVNIRGASSSTLQSDPRPLFVVDGVRAGRSFSRIYTMLNMQNVSSIRLVNLSRATRTFTSQTAV